MRKGKQGNGEEEGPPKRKATWPKPEGYEPEPYSFASPEHYSPPAVLHKGENRGRRSKRFGPLDISKTAAKLGVTKSHLGKVLAGVSTPSAELALKLAQMMNTTTDVILSFRR